MNKYGEKSNTDIQNYIGDALKTGWFIPSSEELAAFGDKLKISRKNNYVKTEIKKYIWTSTQANNINIDTGENQSGAYIADMVICLMGRYPSTRDAFFLYLATMLQISNLKSNAIYVYIKKRILYNNINIIF